jgi:hypothetical protein
MSDTPTPEPETKAADLATAIGNAIIGRTAPAATAAVIEVLHEGGWVVPGVPPVNQVLADARQFSDELVLTKLVARVFRTLILGGLVIPETPQAMNWMRGYIDGDDRRHGPLGKPMVWPDSLPTVTQLLRDWGFQPTPTPVPYVSLRPGGPLTRSAPDPTAPDPAMVSPVPQGRESTMGGLLDETAGAIGVLAVDRMTAIRAMSAAFDRGATHLTPLGISYEACDALKIAAQFIDSAAGEGIELDGVDAMDIVNDLHGLITVDSPHPFHEDAAAFIEGRIRGTIPEFDKAAARAGGYGVFDPADRDWLWDCNVAAGTGEWGDKDRAGRWGYADAVEMVEALSTMPGVYLIVALAAEGEQG